MAELQNSELLNDVTVPTIETKYLADTPEIVPLLAQWHHNQWGNYEGVCTLERRIRRLKHHLQRNAIPTTFVAWVDSEPVGNASLVANEVVELSEWIPWLANVFVVPEYRRSGIGGLLVERVAAEAASLGYPRLYLSTLDQMNFYEEMGWQCSHIRNVNGLDMTVMTRDLIVNPPQLCKFLANALSNPLISK